MAYLHDDVYSLILWVFDLLNQLNDITVLEPFEDITNPVSYIYRQEQAAYTSARICFLSFSVILE
jgi:hypothetical protein